MSSGQVFLDPKQINHRRRRRGSKGLAVNFAAEGVLLKIEESRCALDIGQGFWAGTLRPLENLPATQRPLELPDKLLKVVLHYPVEIDQLTVDVIQHRTARRQRTQEEERRPTSEHFDIAIVGRKQREQFISQAPLAAQPRNDRTCVHNSLQAAALAGLKCGARGPQMIKRPTPWAFDSQINILAFRHLAAALTAPDILFLHLHTLFC